MEVLLREVPKMWVGLVQTTNQSVKRINIQKQVAMVICVHPKRPMDIIEMPRTASRLKVIFISKCLLDIKEEIF